MLTDHLEVPIAWRESGDGRLVLFLHGLGGARRAWDRQLTGLAGRYRCVAWEQPGYGASPPCEFTFHDLADLAVGLLDRLGAERADLVGLSMGGMVAMHTAVRHPTRIRSLALLDTSPAFGFDGVTTPEAWIASRFAPLEEGLTLAELGPQVMRAIMAPGTTEAVVAEGATPMATISEVGFRAAVRCLVTHDVRARLGEIAVPTLVAVGEHDEETPRSYAEALANGIAGARLEVIAGAGHIPPTERPDATNALLAAFLSEVAQ